MPVKRRNTLRRINSSKKRKPSKKKQIRKTRNVNKRNLWGGAMVSYTSNVYPNTVKPSAYPTFQGISRVGGITEQKDTILDPGTEQYLFQLPLGDKIYGATEADPGPDFSIKARMERIQKEISDLEALKEHEEREFSKSKKQIKLKKKKEIHGDRNKKYQTKK